MEIPSLLVVNQSKLELTGLYIEPIDESGNVLPDSTDTLGPFDARVRVQSAGGASQLLPLRGDARSARSRIRGEFGPDQRASFLTDSRARTDGVVELEQHGPARLRLVRSVTTEQTVFTIQDATATDALPTPATDSLPVTCTTHEDWMSRLRDDALLSTLTIPGTHDTCSLYGLDFTICQTKSLWDQLVEGIRFIDIRCRHDKDRFAICHGRIDQKLAYGPGVLYVCLGFLKAFPTETIIMSVKKDDDAGNNTRSFEQTFEWYLQEYQCRERWYLDDKVPKLGDVRRKIVLFRRFSAATTPMGLDASPWPDNATFKIDNAAKMKVQDEYKVQDTCHIDDKWEKVKKLLEEARAAGADPDRWYVNFCSGSGGAFPITIAEGLSPQKGVNTYLQEYLASPPTGRLGTVLMDFVEFPDKCWLLGHLIGQNQRFQGRPAVFARDAADDKKSICVITQDGRLAQLWDTTKWNMSFPAQAANQGNLRFQNGVAVFPIDAANNLMSIYTITKDGRLVQLSNTAANQWNVVFPAEAAGRRDLRFQGIPAVLPIDAARNKKLIYALTTDGNLVQVWDTDTNKWLIDNPAKMSGYDRPFQGIPAAFLADPTIPTRSIYALTKEEGRLMQVWNTDASTWAHGFPQQGLRFQNGVAVFPTDAKNNKKSIYGITTSDELVHMWDTDIWNAFFPLQGVQNAPRLQGIPAIIALQAYAPGRAQVYAISRDSKLVYVSPPTQGGGWNFMYLANGVQFQGSPAVFPRPNLKASIYALTTDGRLAQLWDDDSGWQIQHIDFPAEE